MARYFTEITVDMLLGVGANGYGMRFNDSIHTFNIYHIFFTDGKAITETRSQESTSVPSWGVPSWERVFFEENISRGSTDGLRTSDRTPARSKNISRGSLTV